ncbi:hypothetical protein [Psychromonas ossibalaenae]|uniref:hypothetical protein n=1 Tax=Psychromonas ossibalaenae TaxID=444922 RepID=UPI0012F83793|nr:hypothetical protein [Psychromonas ossibalaenae]
MKYKKSASNALWGILAFIRLITFSFITLISFLFISLMSFLFMGLMLVIVGIQKIENHIKTKNVSQQTAEIKLLELKKDE